MKWWYKRYTRKTHGQYKDAPNRQRIAYLQFSVLQRVFREEAQIRLSCLQRLGWADCRTGRRCRHGGERRGETRQPETIVLPNDIVNVKSQRKCLSAKRTNTNEPRRRDTHALSIFSVALSNLPRLFCTRSCLCIFHERLSAQLR